jgi:uncharacterized protein (DUF1800 family)
MRDSFAGNTLRFFAALVLAVAGWFSSNAFAFPTHTLPFGEWSLISLPADPGGEGTVENLFGDDLPIDDYGSTGRWVMYTYDTSVGEYQQLALDALLKPHAGYWIVQVVSDLVEIDIPEALAPLTGSDISGCDEGKTCNAHPLVRSNEEVVWNLVGYSSETAHTFGESRFVSTGGTCTDGCSPEQARIAYVANNVLYKFNPSDDGSLYETVDASTAMQSWVGYWLAMLPGEDTVEWVLPVANVSEPEPEPDIPDPDPDDSPIEPPANAAPVAIDDTAGPLDAGATVTISVIQNDTDSDGEVIANSVAIVSAPQSGAATVEQDGQITYKHDGSADTESDTLTYTVQDDDGAISNTATVTISPINQPQPQNLAPLAADDAVGPVRAGASLTFSVTDNDTDTDGNIVAATVAIVTDPSHGSAVVGTNGLITYAYDGSANSASDSITYTVQDTEGKLSNVAVVTITLSNDDKESPVETDVPAEDRDAGRLLMQASFGPSDAAIEEVIDLGGPAAWIGAQLQEAPTFHLPMVNALYPNQADRQEGRHQAFWDRAIHADDQLRQRVAFALSHIMVVSQNNTALASHGNMLAAYYDVLLRHAFGNFRDLMEDVTLNPAMGVFLSMLGNDKPDESTGRRADENYARELLQLFSIGLKGLNIDGTEQSGVGTYTQADVENLARVFTGWSWDVDRWRPNHRNGWNGDRTAMQRPMVAFPDHHDTGAKTFLGLEIPAGQSAEADLQMALDRIFMHSNVGPFIAKQLIQRLVTSNPSPGYVARVARTFNDNGSGIRGDMAALVRAILLDSEARDEAISTRPDFGKLRESILRYSHMWRAFRVADSIAIGRGLVRQLPQVSPLTAPSVFNFFRPTYAPPGTLSNAGLVAPEFQINSETNVNDVNRAMIRNGLEDRFLNIDVKLNLDDERAMFSNPEALLTHLDRLLTAGKLSPEARLLLIDYVSNNQGAIDDERILRDVIGLLITSPEFSVQR